MQSSLLELVQYQLSAGRTIYYPMASAIILTFILVLLQRLVAKWIHFTESLYFFSYIPSVIMAVLLTAFTPTINYSIIFFVVIALVGFVLATVYCVKVSSYDTREETSYAKLLTTHSSGMICVLFALGAFSNSLDIRTFENKAAHYINKMDYERALHIGNHSLATSSRLAALRAYAMSKTDKGLGELFFNYPLPSVGAEQLLFAPEDTLEQLLPPDSLYVNLGAWRSPRETALQFLHRAVLRNDSSITKDYWLTALLLEKKVNQFATDLPNYYIVADSVELPKFYQQALAQYVVETGKQISFKGDSVMVRTYYEYKSYEDLYSNALVRENQMRRKFSDTYWWYYSYQH